MKSKILDVFLFYNELDLLKARLEYLGPIVDQFIISEANIDFSGKEKKFLLSRELIETLPYGKKVMYHQEYIHLNSLPWLYKKIKYRNRKNRYLWKIQDAQRNSTLKPLRIFSEDDIIIFSDLDEFPSEGAIYEGIALLRNSKISHSFPKAYSCDQTFFYYNLNNATPDEKFYGSVLTNLKTFRSYLPHQFRSGKNDLSHLKNGGWHFSYFMDEQKILNKIQAIGDVENLIHFMDISTDQIKEKINDSKDLFERDFVLSKNERRHIPDRLLKILHKYLPHSCL